MNDILFGFYTELEKIGNMAGGGYFGSSGLGGGMRNVPALSIQSTGGAGGMKGYKDGGVVTKEQVARVGEDGEEVILPKKKMKTKKDRRVYNYVRDKVR